jgi:hypothetical protein
VDLLYYRSDDPGNKQGKKREDLLKQLSIQDEEEQMKPQYSILLAIAADDETDVANLNKIAHRIVSNLQNDGYRVTPAYSGQRGEFTPLFEIAGVVSTMIMAHQETIGVVANLVTILTECAPIVTKLLCLHEREPAGEHPLRVTLSLGHATIVWEGVDVEDKEWIRQFVERLVAQSPNGPVKLVAHIPPRNKQRRRR